MIFPKPGATPRNELAADQAVLKAGHLRFGRDLAQQVFQGELQAKIAFDADKKCFVLCKASLMTLNMRYPKPAPIMIKQRNLNGELSINVQEWILDHDLPENHSELALTWEERVNLLTIQL